MPIERQTDSHMPLTNGASNERKKTFLFLE
jgi:hypothetical protein